MVVFEKDVKTLFTCKLKFKKDLEKNEFLDYDNGFLVGITEVFGVKLVARCEKYLRHLDGYELIIEKRGKKLTEYHYVESAFYGYVLTEAGYKINKITYVSPYYRTEINWQQYVTKMISELQSTLFAKGLEPKKNYMCRLCEYSFDCFEKLSETFSISVLHGVNEPTKKKMVEHGIKDIQDILVKKSEVIKLLGEVKGNRIISLARAIELKQPVLITKLDRKLKDGLILDIESLPEEDFDYLFGILDSNAYIPFFAESLENEKEIFQSVVKHIKNSNKVIYHFHNYEIQRFRHLNKKYSLGLKEEFYKLFVDVYKLVLNHLALPVPSYSLKTIAKFFGYNWRTDINGQSVMQVFKKYYETRAEEIKKLILIYNEDDVRATKLVLEKLVQLSETESA